MTVLKRTHIGLDGKERSCTARPGQCPLYRNQNIINPEENHTTTLDGEVLTQHQTQQLYTAYRGYHRAAEYCFEQTPGRPMRRIYSSYNHRLKNFVDKYVTLNENGDVIVTLNGSEVEFYKQAIEFYGKSNHYRHYYIPRLEDLLTHNNPEVAEYAQKKYNTFNTSIAGALDYTDQGVPLQLALSLNDTTEEEFLTTLKNSDLTPETINRLAKTNHPSVILYLIKDYMEKLPADALQIVAPQFLSGPNTYDKYRLAANPNINHQQIQPLIAYQNPKINITLWGTPNIPHETLQQIYPHTRISDHPGVINKKRTIPLTPEMLTQIFNDYSRNRATVESIARHPNTPLRILKKIATRKAASTLYSLLKNPNLPDEILKTLEQTPATSGADWGDFYEKIRNHPNYIPQ